MAHVVLDASALLAFLNSEAGADVVANRLPDARISVVNLAEVMGKLVEKGISIHHAQAILAALPIQSVEADEALALRAGALRGETRELGLSLGDRFCLALAEREKAPALTADKSWVHINTTIAVELIR
jgi:ribonuclease VapC